MIEIFSAGCGRRNSARRALPGESVGRKGVGYPIGKLPPPKPSPRGEGGPAKPGRMRGRPCTQPFLVESLRGSRQSPQRNFSPAPLGNPIAPSSVTFGDSFPPRGSLWVVQPYPKKRPKSGHVHGHRNSPTTAPLRYPTPKPASGNERALKKGVQGARPPALFPPAFSGESRAPPPESAGETTWQGWACGGPNRTTSRPSTTLRSPTPPMRFRIHTYLT